MYSQKDIEKLFLKIRNKSYSDYCLSSNVHIKAMALLGYSSPFTGDMYINLDKINDKNMSKNQVIHTIAHELAHQVSYRTRSFFENVFFLWNYWLSKKKRRRVEIEAYKITIERGYDKELLAERKETFKRYANNKEKIAFEKEVYLSIDEVKALLKEYKIKRT